jgi:hypothetical protein
MSWTGTDDGPEKSQYLCLAYRITQQVLRNFGCHIYILCKATGIRNSSYINGSCPETQSKAEPEKGCKECTGSRICRLTSVSIAPAADENGYEIWPCTFKAV